MILQLVFVIVIGQLSMLSLGIWRKKNIRIDNWFLPFFSVGCFV